MRRAYQKSRLDSAQQLLGDYFNLAINRYNYTPEKAYKQLLVSKYSKLIEQGNPATILGMSGYELFYNVTNKPKETNRDLTIILSTTKEYWAGWILAYLQWSTARTFDNIYDRLPFEKIIKMYYPYHEMDERNFVEDVLNRYFSKETNLSMFRKRNHLTQKELARKSQVSIRTIQMIEQRHNDINQVKAVNLFNISRSLNCQMEDLLE